MMGVYLSSSGVKAERDLVHMFWEAGFAVLRAPASGGGTILPRPDLIAGSVKRKKFFVLEIKKSNLFIDIKSTDVNRRKHKIQGRRMAIYYKRRLEMMSVV